MTPPTIPAQNLFTFTMCIVDRLASFSDYPYSSGTQGEPGSNPCEVSQCIISLVKSSFSNSSKRC